MPLATHVTAPQTALVTGSAPPPVVLLHGFASSADEDFLATGWAAAFAGAGRTTIAVDLPGHGGSPGIASAADATTSAIVAAILEAVSQAGATDEFDVVGYSLGARLAWELPAASSGVRRLVLGGISPFEPFAAITADDLAAALSGATPQHPISGMMAGMISAPGRDTASLARAIAGLGSEPFSPGDGGPQVPTLCVAGSADPMAQGIEGLVDGLPRATLTRVPGDHRGALDSPEFRAAALAFLAD
ncbi:alpha/beta fold hydrolase [Leucobacter zeae]|nr:alpha/beta fold hydrolase [Leucobacter zeae]